VSAAAAAAFDIFTHRNADQERLLRNFRAIQAD
jgi:hypothetical protein